MSVIRGKLEFQNVIGMHTRCTYGEWQEKAMQLRAFIIKNNLFITGPIIISWDNIDEITKEADAFIYLPVYQKIHMDDNDIFSFQESFCIKDGLKIRHSEVSDDVSSTEALLQVMAEKADIKIKKPYYYIYLPVFQDYVIDIYAPICEGETT